VISRDVGDHELLRRRQAEQLGVRDEIERVFVVLVVADVVADVVEARRGGEDIAFARLAAQTLAERVEQL